ncbi:MAG: TGS domain-containing protein [Gammaproteobacteria bacterium]|nr:TGS domain-containing protein [Gammaproteobacteria bacterium]MDH3506359.1 TGS domain-containing protein [Gammaproteobacteria bacterium]
MPANLSPDYKKAEQAFRAARDDRDRLACLKDMLRTIPKHKGTEHLQADIKSRIKQLTEELAGPKKGASRTGPVHSVRPEGAAQIALIGPANSGKSSLHAALTGSKADVGPYPHTTHEPLPGMLAYEDIHFQLVDLPPVSSDYMESWYINALQPADAAMLVVDIADPACTEHVLTILSRLDEKKVTLSSHWPGRHDDETNSPADAADELDPFRIYLPTLLVANKSDLDPDPEALAVLEELTGVTFPAMAVSVTMRQGLEGIGRFLFEGLGIVRVYTKTPGKPPEMEKPFTVRQGAMVLDVARLVHKDIAGSLRYARAWGREVFDGQQVGPEHALCDGDVIEMHMR